MEPKTARNVLIWIFIIALITVGFVVVSDMLTGPSKVRMVSSIDHDCTMNGSGEGVCSFTNLGRFSGSVCGTITVESSLTGTKATSHVFCSGDVDRHSTKKVEFIVTEVSTICHDPLSKNLERISKGGQAVSWTDYCSFTFDEL